MLRSTSLLYLSITLDRAYKNDFTWDPVLHFLQLGFLFPVLPLLPPPHFLFFFFFLFLVFLSCYAKHHQGLENFITQSLCSPNEPVHGIRRVYDVLVLIYLTIFIHDPGLCFRCSFVPCPFCKKRFREYRFSSRDRFLSCIIWYLMNLQLRYLEVYYNDIELVPACVRNFRTFFKFLRVLFLNHISLYTNCLLKQRSLCIFSSFFFNRFRFFAFFRFLLFCFSPCPFRICIYISGFSLFGVMVKKNSYNHRTKDIGRVKKNVV